jgi:transcriptional regulator NrdR family protein
VSCCPECGEWKSKTKETRKDTRYGYKWRRKECLECGHIWDTYEIPMSAMEITEDGNPEGKLHR